MEKIHGRRRWRGKRRIGGGLLLPSNSGGSGAFHGSLAVPATEPAALLEAIAALSLDAIGTAGGQRDVVFFTDAAMEDRPGTAEGFALAGGYSVVFRTPDAELPGVYSTLYWKVDRALDITQLKLMAIAEAMGKADSMAKDGKIAKATIKIFTDDQTAIRWIDRVENFRWWLTEPVDTKCLLRRAVAPILNTIAMLSKTLRDEHGSYVEFHSAGNELLHEAIAPVVLAKSAAARACENTGPTTITNSRCQATKNLDAEVIALADAIVP